MRWELFRNHFCLGQLENYPTKTLPLCAGVETEESKGHTYQMDWRPSGGKENENCCLLEVFYLERYTTTEMNADQPQTV